VFSGPFFKFKGDGIMAKKKNVPAKKTAKAKDLIMKKLAEGLRGKTKAEKASKESILSKIEIIMPE